MASFSAIGGQQKNTVVPPFRHCSKRQQEMWFDKDENENLDSGVTRVGATRGCN